MTLDTDLQTPEAKPKATKSRRPKATSTKGHYITNAVLLPEVIRAKELGRVTNELARMLMMIAERYSFKSNFGGYSFRDDMVSFALINLCANALKFNPEKSSNPFSFYTTAIHNSFLQYLAEEKRHREIRDELIIANGGNASNSYNESGHDEGGTYEGAYDEHGEISHHGYSEFHKPEAPAPEPVKKVKTLSGDAAYLQSIVEKGLIDPNKLNPPTEK